jgi:hypothetical protein
MKPFIIVWILTISCVMTEIYIAGVIHDSNQIIGGIFGGVMI